MSRCFVCVLAVVVLFAGPAAATGVKTGTETELGRYEIQLLTISPGPELFTGFGHTALRVIDREEGSDRVFDYGSYDSRDPEMAQKFLLGKLSYWVCEMSFLGAVDGFRVDFGGMHSQTLALSQAQAATIVARLRHDVLPENRSYHYHHFWDNCATRIRDIVDSALDGALAAATQGPAGGMTLRTLIEGALHAAPHFRWPTYGLLNGRIDVPISRWDRMFLPLYLMDELDRLELTDASGRRHPFVSARGQIFGVPPMLPQPTPSLLPWLLVVLGLAVLLGFPAALPWPRFARAWTGGWLALLGLVGAAYGGLMIVLWAFAPYAETVANAHLFVIHPLHLVLLVLGPLAAFGRPGALRWLARYLDAQLVLAVVALVLRAAGLLVQHVEGFVLPVVAAVGAARLTLWRHRLWRARNRRNALFS